jgi:formate hydrogenlyase transcriptional activator
VGKSDALENVLRSAAQVAATDSTVLIQGETGTGKELIARYVHRHSPRAENAFIKLNCAVLQPTLVESELFGHEKGAFTGATQQRQGRFELADGGTIFLDEVSEIPLELQAKLLRVLQEGQFERVGGTKTRKVDVRVIAATNRQLNAAVVGGKFRADLFYRLNVYPITVPPLRARPEDIPPLVRHFTTRIAARMGKKIATIPAASGASRLGAGFGEGSDSGLNQVRAVPQSTHHGRISLQNWQIEPEAVQGMEDQHIGYRAFGLNRRKEIS